MTIFESKFSRRARIRSEREAAWDLKREEEIRAENAVASERNQRIRNIVDAVEAFTDAKIAHASAMTGGRLMGSHVIDVNETREHLLDKLSEVLP